MQRCSIQPVDKHIEELKLLKRAQLRPTQG